MENRTQLTGHNTTYSHIQIDSSTRAVGLDLASSSTGYAVYLGRALMDAGRITAPRALHPIWRARHIAESLPELLDGADLVFAEIPTARTFKAERAGLRAALGVYGLACGLLVARILDICTKSPGMAAWAIPAHWPTGRVKTKAQRRRVIGYLFPDFEWDDDKGTDAIDAASLVLYGLDQLQTYKCDPGCRLDIGPDDNASGPGK